MTALPSGGGFSLCLQAKKWLGEYTDSCGRTFRFLTTGDPKYVLASLVFGHQSGVPGSGWVHPDYIWPIRRKDLKRGIIAGMKGRGGRE